MGLFAANVAKEWRQLSATCGDYAAVALVAVTLLPGDGPEGMALVCGLLAASLGTRIGGDENIHQTWEFVLTRPVGRASWMWLRFRVGLLLLAPFVAFFAAADALDLKVRATVLLARPLAIPPESGDALRWALGAAIVLLAYGVAFQAARQERRPSHVLSGRIKSVSATATLLLIAYVVDQQVRGVRLEELTIPALPFLFVVVVFCLLLSASLHAQAARQQVGASLPVGPVDVPVASWSPLALIVLVALLFAFGARLFELD